MSSTLTRNVKKTSRRSSSRRVAAISSSRKQGRAKSTRLKPATKRSAAGKAPARKATKTKPRAKAAAPTRKSPTKTTRHERRAKPSTRPVVRSKRPTAKTKAGHVKPSLVLKRPVPTQPPPQPTGDEAAALKAFEAAHKEFSRGHFAEARSLFRSLVEKYPTVSEVTARARTYLAVAEARLRTEMALPRDADSLYDRGVIELNRGEYVAAQELFERALKREPEAAHIHYGLAATRARLGAIDTALKSLDRALDLQPSLRIRAQRDQDLNPLRSDPDFENLVFATRD